MIPKIKNLGKERMNCLIPALRHGHTQIEKAHLNSYPLCLAALPNYHNRKMKFFYCQFGALIYHIIYLLEYLFSQLLFGYRP